MQNENEFESEDTEVTDLNFGNPMVRAFFELAKDREDA